VPGELFRLVVDAILLRLRDAVEPLDDDEKGVTSIHTPGGEQVMIIVSESGLYMIVLRNDARKCPTQVSAMGDE